MHAEVSVDKTAMSAGSDRRWIAQHWGMLLAALLGLVGYVGMVVVDAREGTLRDEFVTTTLWLYGIAFVGFLIAVWWNEKHSIPWRWLWAVPVLFRVLLLFTSPSLSDDVYLYLWDGHLSTQGVNPYEFATNDPALDPYEIDARNMVNGPTYGTEYLPTAQAVWAAGALVAPSEPWTLQILMVGFDLFAAAIIVGLLRLASLPPGRVVLYLWNPLAIVEVAHSAHIDAIMVSLALLAVYLALRTSTAGGWSPPVVLALATLTRPVPLLLLPVLWWRWSWKQRITYAATSVVLVLPFGITGGWHLTGDPVKTGVFGASRVFVETVTFNGGIYRWVEGWWRRAKVDDPAGEARFVLAIVLIAIVAAVWWRARKIVGDDAARSARQTLRLAIVPLTGLLFLTSILHPWYILIAVAFLPFLAPANNEPVRRWLLVTPWIWLSWALSLSYLTYRDPLQFGELTWVRRVEWWPAIALLGLGIVAVGTLRQRTDNEPAQGDVAIEQG